jgi:hypothetical protein
MRENWFGPAGSQRHYNNNPKLQLVIPERVHPTAPARLAFMRPKAVYRINFKLGTLSAVWGLLWPSPELDYCMYHTDHVSASAASTSRISDDEPKVEWWEDKQLQPLSIC